MSVNTISKVGTPATRRDRAHRAIPTTRLRRDLRAMIGDGAAFSIMVGLGETYLPAFVLALGLGQVAAGLVATIPLLAGALLQLVSPVAVRRLGSHRRWVVACAAVQAASFLPLCVAAVLGHMPVVIVFAVAAVYWGAGLGTGPAWNTWVESIVPQRVRAHYFSQRTRLTQCGVLAGFLVGGATLQWGALNGHLLWAFGVLFLVAAICRFISAAFMARQSEPAPPGDDHRHVPLAELVARMRHGGEARLLVYLLAVQTAVQLSGPYFTPYMLTSLKLSYARYVMLMAVAFGAKIFALPLFGRVVHRWGARRLLWIGGVGIAPLASLWLVSDSYAYLLCVQIVAGATWAAYELAMFLLFFETIPAEERTSVLTTFNLANAVATVGGSLLGGALLLWLGKNPSTYHTLFVLSTGLRFLTVLLLCRLPAFQLTEEPLATRTLTIRPTDGALDQPVLPSLTDGPRVTRALAKRA